MIGGGGETRRWMLMLCALCEFRSIPDKRECVELCVDVTVLGHADCYVSAHKQEFHPYPWKQKETQIGLTWKAESIVIHR